MVFFSKDIEGKIMVTTPACILVTIINLCFVIPKMR